MRAAAAGLVLLSIAGPALAQPRGPAPGVEWFVQNSQVRADIMRLCADQPGEAQRNDYCQNAWAANLEAARREAHARLRLTSPSTLRYWLDRPEERREHVNLCRNMQAADAARAWCPQAQAAEEQARTPPPVPSEKRPIGARRT